MSTMLQVLFWSSLGLLGYSYFIYPLLLMLFAYRCGKPICKDENYRPSIGVLVPAHNEEKVICKKIDSILALEYPPQKISVWVGSDCSTDNTDRLIEEYGDPRVHLWKAPDRGGKTGILNRLGPQVDADVILFTDANTMHRRDSIRMIARNFADPQVGAVAGHIEHMPGGDDEYAETFYRRFESRQKYLEGVLHSTISAFGGFYAVRRELFRPIPPTAYSNDDVLIPMDVIRQGYRVVYESEAVSEEETAEKIGAEFKRRVRIGAGNFQSFSWLLDFLNPFRGWPCFCYVSHKVTRWFSPFFFLLSAAACTGLFLSGGAVLYSMIFMAGVVMTVAGLLYKCIPLRITRHIFYFIVMNTALLLGCFRYMRGIRTAAWSRTERVEKRGQGSGVRVQNKNTEIS
jgi:cellulose synthase/poly-beta-1,6-N-acetylglucosamine synthase-like glycosyltransferase